MGGTKHQNNVVTSSFQRFDVFMQRPHNIVLTQCVGQVRGGRRCTHWERLTLDFGPISGTSWVDKMLGSNQNKLQSNSLCFGKVHALNKRTENKNIYEQTEKKNRKTISLPETKMPLQGNGILLAVQIRLRETLHSYTTVDNPSKFPKLKMTENRLTMMSKIRHK